MSVVWKRLCGAACALVVLVTMVGCLSPAEAAARREAAQQQALKDAAELQDAIAKFRVVYVVFANVPDCTVAFRDKDGIERSIPWWGQRDGKYWAAFNPSRFGQELHVFVSHGYQPATYTELFVELYIDGRLVDKDHKVGIQATHVGIYHRWNG